jgi:UDP-galactopyranose mutase
MNKYGAHLFHTNKEKVWEYINKFDKWTRWEHKVLTYVDDKFVSIPVNITTINQLCQENLKDENDVKEWLERTQVKYDNITNSEEMAKSRIGEVLYDKLIRDYTYKQWNKYPEELDKSVLERIPIRNNFDTRYFNDKYQALPHKGYTHFFERLLDNKNIEVLLNTDYFEYIKDKTFDMIIFTGPIDNYFNNELDKLEYRSIDFNIEIIKNMNYYQPNSVVNYPNNDVKYTRIVEYKHFLNQKSKDTIIVKEITNDQGEPYYPVPNKKNLDLYREYKKLAEEEEKKNVYFIGRLANYKYFNMDEAIENSLKFFEDKFLN